MKPYLVKVINVERHECQYVVDAENEKEARETFLTDGEECNDKLLDSDVDEILSVMEA